MTTKICRCPKNQKGANKAVESNVRENILSAMSLKPVVQKAPVVQKRIGGSKFVTAFLGSVIVLLMMTTTWFAFSKFNTEGDYNPVVIVPDNRCHPKVETEYLTKHQAETMMVQVQDRIDNIEQKMEMWNHRAWLLALAVNENANISQCIDNRYHRCHPHNGYIVFDQNWKINRYPHTMNLTEQQRLEIRNDVR